ncbi:hypothetical protein QJS66_22695 [Kocuria rhizophila]|nr:hypothetical protein QJS66_22695 [Kocuria rhizophila]
MVIAPDDVPVTGRLITSGDRERPRTRWRGERPEQRKKRAGATTDVLNRQREVVTRTAGGSSDWSYQDQIRAVHGGGPPRLERTGRGYPEDWTWTASGMHCGPSTPCPDPQALPGGGRYSCATSEFLQEQILWMPG